jgi:thiamine pyrophosphokinase
VPTAALVLVHGDAPDPALLAARAATADWFVCTDGAVRTALAAGVTPDAVIGDMDSVGRARPEGPVVAPMVQWIEVHDQETTDLEKALLEAIRRGCARVVVLGAAGRRWDHFYGHLSLFARFADRLQLEAEDAHGRLRVLPPGPWFELDLPPGEKLSLIPLPRAMGIETEGLRWPLVGATLALGEREGISNAVERAPARVRYAAGCLALYEVGAE